jgi:hypothetical protein
METKLILKIMNVIIWIIFVGLCIKTGAIIYSFLLSLIINPIAAKNIYMGLNLLELFNFSLLHYVFTVGLIIVIWGLKALLFYFIIKISQKINFLKPFRSEVTFMIHRIFYLALGIGIISVLTNYYLTWILNNGISLNNIYEYVYGGQEFLFLAAVIFVIAQLFKRGIELQTENELTV